MYRSWLEIDAKALRSNIEAARSLAPQSHIVSVVKANAYGHGAELVSQAIETATDWFAVDSFFEATELKTSKPILILGMMMPEECQRAIDRGFSFVIGSLDGLREIAEMPNRNRAKIHLKIETGTLRQGLQPQDLPQAVELIQSSGITIEGITTHFADVEEDDLSFARTQLERFDIAVAYVQEHLGIMPLRHIACSAAIMKQIGAECELVRLGISLYGLWSSPSAQLAANLALHPALSWHARIVQVKDVLKGETIGYDRTYAMPHDGKIAILPIGYYDGFDRRFGNKGSVIIDGQRCPIIGRICMNMCMVDVSGVPQAKRLDTVTILGKNGQEHLTADELAETLGTIHYELTTRIGRHLPRILV